MSEVSPPSHKWQCELQGNDAAQTHQMFVDFDGLNDEELDSQNIASGRTTLKVQGAMILPNGKLQIPGGAKKEFGKVQPRGPAAAEKNTKRLPTNPGNSNGNQQKTGNTGTVKDAPLKQGNSANNGSQQPPKYRTLQSTATDTRKVLAVRIKANDRSSTPSTSTIADEVFGTSGDLINLSERFKSCSYDQVLMQPYQGSPQRGPPIVNGVIEVTINNNVIGVSDGTIREAAINAATAAVGDLPSQFDHVVLCIPPGTSGDWIAYAYIDHWLSVYNDVWCNYPSSLVHEIGHNLNLDHAWENNQEYMDQTGMMGLSYSQDEGPVMCYNPAKSWQLGWYPERTVALDLSVNGYFAGSLIGIDSYKDTNAGDKKVIIKIENGATDYYVGFNRKSGINSGTQEYGNRVTVHSQGAGSSRSDLLATFLAAGEKTFQNYKGTSESFTIKVNAINLSASPPSADIQIYLGSCASSSSACNPACGVCCADSDCIGSNGMPVCATGTCGTAGTCSYDTSGCPGNFKMTVITDNYPDETTWKLVNECDATKPVVLSGGPYARTDKLKTFVQETVIGKTKYTLYVYDSAGDGVCCGYGAGSFSATLDGVMVASGGQFQSQVAFTFGACDSTTPSTPPPTPSPTPPPTAPQTPPPTLSTPPPTRPPTPPPTPPQTPPPTLLSTPPPTRPPTVPPTVPPTPPPTQPQTPLPTPPPTSPPTPPPTPMQSPQSSFELAILTDNYPSETTWQLVENCGTNRGNIVVSGGPYTSKGNTALFQQNIPSSRYTLIMKDSRGDGICCGYGNGSYTAKVGGIQVASGGYFTNSESTTFGTCPNQVNLNLKLTVKTDNYPDETTWQIMDTCTNNLIVFSGGPYASAGTTITRSYDLPSDRKYTLTIFDSQGDGICCGYGNGSYKVEVNAAVIKSGGAFTTSESVSFGASTCLIV